MNKRLILLLAILIPFAMHAQSVSDTTQRTFAEATYFSGGLGLQFGTVTSIQISPGIGYKVDREGKFSVGTNLMYWYYKDNRFTPPYEASTYGYSLFSRYRFIENLYGHIEFQQQSVQRGNIAIVPDGGKIPREWVPFLYVGAGYAAALGGNTYLMAQVMWDVIQDPRSPYLRGQPIYNIGIGAGF